jgi:SAM-dependent methyltransferase
MLALTGGPPEGIETAAVPADRGAEKLARGERGRVPEPMVMDEPQGVQQYDEIGGSVQVGIHHFNALGISRLLPRDGMLLDLGCGSGRLLARLAHGRPDARLIGLDLSEPMLETGRRMLEREGLADRVELRRGDITTFDAELSESFHVISCNFTLHQLPSEDLARSCLEAIAVPIADRLRSLDLRLRPASPSSLLARLHIDRELAGAGGAPRRTRQRASRLHD